MRHSLTLAELMLLSVWSHSCRTSCELQSRVCVSTEPLPAGFADDLDVSAPEADLLPSEAALPEPQAADGHQPSSA